jgi:stage V sporulation protein G
MSWPTPSSGPRKDPYGRQGRDEVPVRSSDSSASYESRLRNTAPQRGKSGDASLHEHPSGISITDVQVRLVDNDRLRAWATITFNGAFVIKGIRIIKGNQRLFVAMPSKQQKDGKYQDIAHPISGDFREYLESRILEVYRLESERGGMRATPEDEFA